MAPEVCSLQLLIGWAQTMAAYRLPASKPSGRRSVAATSQVRCLKVTDRVWLMVLSGERASEVLLVEGDQPGHGRADQVRQVVQADVGAALDDQQVLVLAGGAAGQGLADPAGAGLAAGG